MVCEENQVRWRLCIVLEDSNVELTAEGNIHELVLKVDVWVANTDTGW